MGITKHWGKVVVVAGCLGLTASVARAGYDENVGAAADSNSSNMSMSSGSMSSGSMSSGSMSNGSMMNGSMRMSRSEMRMKNAQMLVQTLSEEKTEINELKMQRMALMRMGGADNMRLARLLGRWEAEHKAAGPGLKRLIRLNGGNPMDAKILMSAPTGSMETILMSQHKGHNAAVMTSQMCYMMTNNMAIKTAMHKRANLARKHLRQMEPYHAMMGKMSGDMDMNPTSSTTSSTTTTTTTGDMATSDDTMTTQSTTETPNAGDDTKGADGAGTPGATTPGATMNQ